MSASPEGVLTLTIVGKKTCAALIALTTLALAACSGADPTPTPRTVPTTEPATDPTPTPTAQVVTVDGGGRQLTVHLSANGSAQTGTAVFTEVTGGFDLRVNVTNSVPVQMLSLRRGECPDVGGFERSLDPLVGGVSNQQVRGYTFDTLTRGSITLVVSGRSSGLLPVSACADIPTMSQTASS